MESIDREERHIQEPFLNELSKKIHMIRIRFDDIKERREALQLREDYGDRFQKTLARHEVGHLVNQPIMYGRDKDKNRLVDLLKNDDYMMPKEKYEYVSMVVSLIGVGGIGKTTLAQAIYNDKEVKKHFDCMAWVHVSMTFNVVQITKKILESLRKKASNLTQLSVIQEELISQLHGKKFFLVLDDMWEEEPYDLEFLLQLGLVGSKILITTRTTRVAKAMHSQEIFYLKPLKEEDGRLLFYRHAFQGIDIDRVPTTFLEMGMEIAKKCEGLPLLLKILGDDLREASNQERWREILNHETWEIKDDSGNNNVMEVLKLSYIYLPVRLKQCFLYSAIFPKNYVFHKDELARLWSAYGLNEVEGTQQVDSLLQRSFIQPQGYKYSWYSRKANVAYSLHDVLHDLAQYILKSEQSLSKIHANTLTLHHLLFQEHNKHSMQPWQKSRCCYEPIIGRTFLQFWYPSKELRIDALVVHLRCLRVLILEDQFLNVIPDSIGDLKHLRYLYLHTPCLKRLPDSICSLYNLQTLECQYLEELPRDIRKLKRLHHLLVNLAKMPLGFGELVELRTLKKFRLSTGGDYACLPDLKDLRCLTGEFKISGLNYVDDAENAKLSNMCNKPDLQHLVLEWDPIENDDCERNLLILDYMKPHGNLEELDILFYVGAQFPKWLGSNLFTKLTIVTLFYCLKCKELPALGQLPSLRELTVRNMHSLYCIGPEFYGRSSSNAFRSLQTLSLCRMKSLREWQVPNDCHFPQLLYVRLSHCPSLRISISCTNVEPNVSHMFDTIQTMVVVACPHVENWCRAHSGTILANIENLTLNLERFYFPRQGDQTFFCW